MSVKPYGLGILVGRFQILHRGHGEIIRTAFENCERVGILIGSSQESGTYKNPFSFETRRRLLQTAFPDAEIRPLPDIGVGNNLIWGRYVLERAQICFGRKPDVLVSGQEDRRIAWLDDSMGIAEIYVPKTINISSTAMKDFAVSGDRASWDRFIEPAIAGSFEEMRDIIIRTSNVLETKSI